MSAMTNTHAQETTGSIATRPQKPLFKRILNWLPFTLLCLTLFTLAKLPTFQFQNIIQDKIFESLRPLGITLSAEQTKFGFLTGLSYTLTNATVTLAKSRTTLKYGRITLRPKLLPLLSKKFGINAVLLRDKSAIEIDATGNQSHFDASVDFSEADLTQFGLFEILSQFITDPFDVMGTVGRTKPQLILDGGLQIAGSPNEPNSMKGQSNLKIKKISIRNLKLPIFEIPKVEISEGLIKTNIVNGKLNFESVTFGKPAAKDDLFGTATGTLDLGKSSFDSRYNVKVKFGISEELAKTFGPLLGAILGPAKQPDGMYAYNILGSVARPIATPGN